MSNARFVFTFVALFAFSIQSYLTQTHIHFPASFSTPLALSNFDTAKASAAELANIPGDKSPASDDPATCPICQEIMYAGQYVVPAVTALALPTVMAIGPVLFAEETFRIQAVSYSWQGRAPPLA